MFETSFLIAVVMGMTEFFKRMDWVKNRYLPLLSLGLGLIAGILYGRGTTLKERIPEGLLIGLAAAGLFDQTKILTKRNSGSDSNGGR
jgi:hypothetical protein